MPCYTISKDGMSAWTALATKLRSSAGALEDANAALQATIAPNVPGLGPYESAVHSTVESIVEQTCRLMDESTSLAVKVDESVEIMAQMLRALDEEAMSVPVTEEPSHRSSIIPTEKTGTRLQDDGEGNFEFIPNNEAAQQALKELGQSSVAYIKRHPDFSPFVAKSTPWGELDCQVVIGHMTDVRIHSGENDFAPGNYQSADEQLRLSITKANPTLSITAKDVEQWRTAEKLTWHECADGYTMQLIPTVIHSSCKHSGGVSEMRYRMEYGALSLDQFEKSTER